MDPDACLEELRELITQYNADAQYDFDRCDRIVELVEALDEWLSKGGYPPKAWENAHPRHWQKVLASVGKREYDRGLNEGLAD